MTLHPPDAVVSSFKACDQPYRYHSKHIPRLAVKRLLDHPFLTALASEADRDKRGHADRDESDLQCEKHEWPLCDRCDRTQPPARLARAVCDATGAVAHQAERERHRATGAESGATVGGGRGRGRREGGGERRDLLDLRCTRRHAQRSA
jgi:hypothetical protein